MNGKPIAEANESAERQNVTRTRMLINGSLKGRSFEDWMQSVAPLPSLSAFLLPRLRDMSYEEIASRASIGRSTFYAAMAEKKRPEQDMLLRIAFVLKLSAAETQQLLKTGRRAMLTASVKRDVAIIYGLENGLLLEEMDALLIENQLKPLLPP